MPIYEYACGKCGHEFEVEQRITDDPIKTCPACRSRKVKKLISQTSFVLKGGGWYSDLYSSTGGKKDEGKESGDGKADKKDSGDKDAKPSKSEPKSPKPDTKSDKKGKGKGKKAAA
jgi:putative FmdB family regulatory protein